MKVGAALWDGPCWTPDTCCRRRVAVDDPWPTSPGKSGPASGTTTRRRKPVRGVIAIRAVGSSSTAAITIGPVETELEAESLGSQQGARDCRVGIAEVIDGRVDERTASDAARDAYEPDAVGRAVVWLLKFLSHHQSPASRVTPSERCRSLEPSTTEKRRQ